MYVQPLTCLQMYLTMDNVECTDVYDDDDIDEILDHSISR